MLLVVKGVDVVFESHPRSDGDAKDEVEETFVGDGEDDKGWGKGEKDDDEPVEVVIVGLHAVEKGYREGGDWIWSV